MNSAEKVVTTIAIMLLFIAALMITWLAGTSAAEFKFRDDCDDYGKHVTTKAGIRAVYECKHLQ